MASIVDWKDTFATRLRSICSNELEMASNDRFVGRTSFAKERTATQASRASLVCSHSIASQHSVACGSIEELRLAAIYGVRQS